MSGSQREDFVLRQLKMIAAMLARIFGLRTSGETEEARIELEQAYALLLGSQAELLRRIDSPTAAALLGSPEKIHMFALLLHEEAAQEKDKNRSLALRRRALELCGEVLHRDPGNGPATLLLKELAQEVDRQQPSPRPSPK